MAGDSAEKVDGTSEAPMVPATVARVESATTSTHQMIHGIAVDDSGRSIEVLTSEDGSKKGHPRILANGRRMWG